MPRLRRAPGDEIDRRQVRSRLVLRSRSGRRARRPSLLFDHHFVYETVLLCLTCAHEMVAICILLDPVERLPGVLHDDLIQLRLQAQDFLRVQLDVARLPAEPAARLVDHDAGMGEGKALSLRAGRQQERRHRGRHAHADGRDPRLHVLHRVVDGEAGGDRTARAVDVQADVLVGILALEEEHLRDDHVGDVVVKRRAEEDDAILQEARVDVVGALAAVRLLHDEGHRDVGHRNSPGAGWDAAYVKSTFSNTEELEQQITFDLERRTRAQVVAQPVDVDALAPARRPFPFALAASWSALSDRVWRVFEGDAQCARDTGSSRLTNGGPKPVRCDSALTVCTSRSMSTGLERCSWNPAANERRRSSSPASAANAMAGTCASRAGPSCRRSRMKL